MNKAFSSVVVASLFGTICTYFFTVIATHIMAVSTYGLFSKWLTDISYLGFFFTMGLNSSMIYYYRKDKPIKNSLGDNLFVYTLALTCWIFITIFLSTNFIYHLTLGVSIYLFSINQLISSYVQLKENFLVYSIIQILRPILLTGIFGLIFIKKIELIGNIPLIVYTCVMVCTSVILWITFFSKGGEIKIAPHKSLKKSYFTYGLKSVTNQVLAQTMYAITIYMVSWLLNKESVAFFFVANSISKMAWVFPDAAGNILYPKFIKSKTTEDQITTKKIMFKYILLIMSINIIILLLFIAVGQYFLDIFYTSSYKDVFSIVIILLIGNQGMVMYKILSRWFSSQNDWKYMYIALIGGILVNILFNVFLIPNWGIYGASISSLLGFWACGLIISIPMKKDIVNFFIRHK